MSIFSRLFKSRAEPKNSLPGDGYRPYIGRTTSGNSVTQRSSMQLTAVYCCVRVLAEAVAGLPLITYRRAPSRERRIIRCIFFCMMSRILR